MHHLKSSCAPARRTPRRLRAAVGFAAFSIVFGAAFDHVEAIDAPRAIPGDPHSPRVARLATLALEAKHAYDVKGFAADRTAYEMALSDAATATAGEMAVSPSHMVDAWQHADSAHQTAVLTALTQLGAPYSTNSSDPEQGFDCSGLTAYAWGEAGVQLTRQSSSQISEADARDVETAVAGDLAQYPGHVMIYLGVPGAFVDASNHENDVQLYLPSEDRADGFRYGDPTA